MSGTKRLMVDNFEQNPFFYYLLGLLWADAAVPSDGYMVRLYGLESDLKHIEPKILETGNWHKQLLYRKGRKPQLIFTMYDKKLRDFLLQHNYASKNQSTNILDSLTEEKQKLWLQGFLDGDGTIAKGKQIRVGFSGPHGQDWSFLNKILERLNIEPYYYQGESKLGHKSSQIIIKNIIDSLVFLNYIYDTPYDFGYVRKKKHYFDYLKEYQMTIQKLLNNNIKYLDGKFQVKIKNRVESFNTLEEAKKYRMNYKLKTYGKTFSCDRLDLNFLTTS